MKPTTRRPLSKSEWLLFLAPLLILVGLGAYTVLRPLFPRVLRGHKGEVVSLQFSPDGSKIAIAIDYKGKGELKPEISLWDVNALHRLWGHTTSTGISHLKFSPDGRVFSYSGYYQPGQITFRNTQTGNTLRVAPRFYEWVFVGQEQTIVRSRKTMELQDISSGRVLQKFSVTPIAWPWSYGWSLSRDDQTLAVLNREGTQTAYHAQPILWKAQSGKRMSVLQKRRWTSVEFFNAQTLLLTELEQGSPPHSASLQLWNWKSERRVRVLANGITHKYHLTPDKQQLAFSTTSQRRGKEEDIFKNSEISVLLLPEGKLKWNIRSDSEISSLISDDSMNFLLSTEKEENGLYRKVALRNGKSGEVLAVYDNVTATAISPDGTTIATGDAEGNVRLYDTRRFVN